MIGIALSWAFFESCARSGCQLRAISCQLLERRLRRVRMPDAAGMDGLNIGHVKKDDPLDKNLDKNLLIFAGSRVRI